MQNYGLAKLQNVHQRQVQNVYTHCILGLYFVCHFFSACIFVLLVFAFFVEEKNRKQLSSTHTPGINLFVSHQELTHPHTQREGEKRESNREKYCMTLA